MRFSISLTGIGLGLLLFPSPVLANDLLDIRGYLEPEARAFVDRTHPEWAHSSMPDARLELRAYPGDQVDAAIVGDLNMRYADVITPEVSTRLRELWVRFYQGPLTMSMGRQIHTWGTIQDFGVTDILNPQQFPDLTQDHTNRKIGIWSWMTSYDLQFMQAELYVMPYFQPSELPADGAFAEAALPRPLQRAIRAEAERGRQAGRDAEQELEAGQQQVQQGQAEIDAAYDQIAQGHAQLDAAEAQIQDQLQAAAAMPDSPEKSALEAELHAALAGVHHQRAALEREAALLDQEQVRLGEERERLASARDQLEAQSAHSQDAWDHAMANPVRKIPPRQPRSTQVAGRLYFPLDVGDFSLGVARMYDQIGTLRFEPGANPGDAPQLTIEHPRLTAWTLSGAIPMGSLGIRFEGLYLHTADPRGRDPFVRNPTLQTAAQLIWDPTNELTLRAGIQDEQIFAVDDAAEKADQYSLPSPVGSTLLLLADHIAHTAVTYRWGTSMHQITAAYMWAYEADGHFFSPEVDLALVPGLRLRVGAQLYAGRSDRRGFGQLSGEDNVFVAMRASF